MNNKEIKNSRDYLRQLTNIAYLGMSLPLLLFGWFYLEVSNHKMAPRVDERHVVWIFLSLTGLMLLSFYMGNRLHQRKLMIARSRNTLREKLHVYKSAVYSRFIYFTVGALLITLGIYITASELFAISFSIVIVLFSINNPTLYRIVKALQLEGEERDIVLKSRDF